MESFEFKSSGGTKLVCKCWKPIDPPIAVLFIVHGLGEHSGRYEEMASIFAENHFAVFAFDLRGHGKSEGKRGDAESIDQLVEDVEFALMKCRSLYLEIPVFLYGHSMGGQIVASYLDKVKSKEIKGAIVSSAWFWLVVPPPQWQIKVVKKLKSIFPGFTQSNGLDPINVSSVTAEVELYQKDPLIHDKISLSLFHALYHNGLKLVQHAQPTKIPILVCHGGKDQITSQSGSEQYSSNLGKKAEFKIWHSSFHEPHHDFEKKKVMQFYVDWVKSRIIK